MIKEFFSRTKTFLKDVWSNPSWAFQNYWWYLTKGYSYSDMQDMDYYLLEKMKDILPEFIKHTKGHPTKVMGKKVFHQKYWLGYLKSLERDLKVLLSDNYDWKRQEKAKIFVKGFLYKHYFDLWF